jgi:hypothetical protein
VGKIKQGWSPPHPIADRTPISRPAVRYGTRGSIGSGDACISLVEMSQNEGAIRGPQGNGKRGKAEIYSSFAEELRPGQ